MDALADLRQRLLALRAAVAPNVTALHLVTLVRYANQTTVYGPGHRIIGNIGNGAGIKAEAQLHYGVHEKSTPKVITARADRAAAKLTPEGRTAMVTRQAQLVTLAATIKDPAEQAAARTGAILLQRQISRYDKAHQPGAPATVVTIPASGAKLSAKEIAHLQMLHSTYVDMAKRGSGYSAKTRARVQQEMVAIKAVLHQYNAAHGTNHKATDIPDSKVAGMGDFLAIGKNARDVATDESTKTMSTGQGTKRMNMIDAIRLHLTLLRLGIASELRYKNQTVIYGAGHKIIGNIGNGAGIAAEAQLHYGVHGKSTPEALQAKAQKATTTLTAADRTAMTNRRDELIDLAVKSTNREEQMAARDGAIILHRQLGRYDQTHPHETSARLQKEQGLRAETKVSDLPTGRHGQILFTSTGTTKANIDPFAPVVLSDLTKEFGEHQIGAYLSMMPLAKLVGAAHSQNIPLSNSANKAKVLADITAHLTHGRYSANFSTPAKTSAAKATGTAKTTGASKSRGGSRDRSGKSTVEPLFVVKGYDESPFAPLDPSAYNKMYGTRQLSAALNEQTMTKLRGAANNWARAHPEDGKPASLTKKADLVAYLSKAVPARDGHVGPKTQSELDAAMAQARQPKGPSAPNLAYTPKTERR